MEVPTWLSRLMVAASIAMAIAANLTNINPKFGIAAMVFAGIVAAFSDGVKMFILPAGVTIAGVLSVAGAVILYITGDTTGLFSFIPAHVFALLAQIGPILAIIGGRLKEAPPIGGGN